MDKLREFAYRGKRFDFLPLYTFGVANNDILVICAGDSIGHVDACDVSKLDNSSLIGKVASFRPVQGWQKTFPHEFMKELGLWSKFKLGLAEIVRDFKLVAIWQDEELNELGLTISDFDKSSCESIVLLVSEFIDQLDDYQVDALIKDNIPIGQSLCLELMGHGSGFFDFTCEIVSSISNCDFITNHRIESVYLDDKELKLDVIEIGVINK